MFGLELNPVLQLGYDNHLEWLYRLYQEPWRWRQMLCHPSLLGKLWFIG